MTQIDFNPGKLTKGLKRTVIAVGITNAVLVALLSPFISYLAANRESKDRSVSLAIEILRNKETLYWPELRYWAVKIVERDSGIAFSEKARKELTEQFQLDSVTEPNFTKKSTLSDAAAHNVFAFATSSEGGPVDLIWNAIDAQETHMRFEVHRAEGSASKFDHIGIVSFDSGKSFYNYSDATAEKGKVYQYKIFFVWGKGDAGDPNYCINEHVTCVNK